MQILSSHYFEIFKKKMLTFQLNPMFVSQIEDVISHFGLDWNPLTRPINIHNIYPKQESQTATHAYYISVTMHLLFKLNSTTVSVSDHDVCGQMQTHHDKALISVQAEFRSLQNRLK